MVKINRSDQQTHDLCIPEKTSQHILARHHLASYSGCTHDGFAVMLH